MRTMRKLQQNMFYANYVDAETIYKLDENGDKIYIYTDDEGVDWYEEEGTVEPHYTTPIFFEANISSKLNEMHAREYGVDSSSIYAQIECKKGKLPFKFGTVIWKNSPIKWKDEDRQIPDEESADYKVVGLLDEYLNYDWYLLQRIVH